MDALSPPGALTSQRRALLVLRVAVAPRSLRRRHTGSPRVTAGVARAAVWSAVGIVALGAAAALVQAG